MRMASVMPSKSTGQFLANRFMGCSREIGLETTAMRKKSEGEPAMKSVVSDVSRLRSEKGGGRFIPDCSSVGSSQSNGLVERYILYTQCC